MKLDERINALLDRVSAFVVRAPGALPLVGLLLIVVNLILQIVPGPGSGWLVDSNLFLHLGLIVAIIGLLLIRALTRR
ncbi:MAG: hypothetical protein KC425_00795 [Anaerolineales bacterium]|nr:hypothetical protein [Anaerolineales bacterium]